MSRGSGISISKLVPFSVCSIIPKLWFHINHGMYLLSGCPHSSHDPTHNIPFANNSRIIDKFGQMCCYWSFNRYWISDSRSLTPFVKEKVNQPCHCCRYYSHNSTDNRQVGWCWSYWWCGWKCHTARYPEPLTPAMPETFWTIVHVPELISL